MPKPAPRAVPAQAEPAVGQLPEKDEEEDPTFPWVPTRQPHRQVKDPPCEHARMLTCSWRELPDLTEQPGSTRQHELVFHTIRPFKMCHSVVWGMFTGHGAINIVKLGMFSSPPKRNCAPQQPHPTPPPRSPPRSLTSSPSLQTCPLWTAHVSGIRYHVTFCVWLLSPRILSPRLIREVAHVGT